MIRRGDLRTVRYVQLAFWEQYGISGWFRRTDTVWPKECYL